MDLTKDYFSNLGLPCRYQIDMAALAKAHRQLQQVHHPDRFAAGTDIEQRRAVQVAAYLNQANAVLRSPLRRAIYLLELLGMEPLAPTNTSMPMDFLLQQMQLRERMEAVPEAMDIETELEQMAAELLALHKQLQVEFATAYGDNQLQVAEVAVRKLQFIDKLQQECNDLEGRLLD
ncbi:MAG: Fe-S protein assembly co-chaperone HscB [Gammaproteobacteria bacterium]|nr:Fe-S protein assembly co-chaperone HscB [Gammaproteobacteria bacterium]